LIFSPGTLHPRYSILNATRNERERPSKLLLLYADREVEVDSLPFGSVGVILGLKHTRAGDTLCGASQSSNLILPDISAPVAVITSSLIPLSYSDEQPLQAAVNDLIRTDPSVRFEIDQDQMLIHAMGPLHLEIVESRLRDEWGARFELGPPRVSYRETLADGQVLQIAEQWDTQIQGTKVDVFLEMILRPLNEMDGEVGHDAWGNNCVFFGEGPLAPPTTRLTQGNICIENALAQGLSNVLSNSPHSSFPLTNLRIDVKRIDVPPHAPQTCVIGAATSILTNALKNGGPGSILEPYVELNLEVQEQHVGPIIAGIGLRGGEILDLESEGVHAFENTRPYKQDGLYIPPEWLSPCASSSNAAQSATAVSRRTVSARGPLAHFLDFPQRLKSLTGGHGLFTSTNIGHRRVGESREQEILREIGRA
jgi:elongation factor G